MWWFLGLCLFLLLLVSKLVDLVAPPLKAGARVEGACKACESGGEPEEKPSLWLRLSGPPGVRRETLRMLEELFSRLEGAELVVHIAVPEERLAETQREVARLVAEMKARNVDLEVIAEPPPL